MDAPSWIVRDLLAPTAGVESLGLTSQEIDTALTRADYPLASLPNEGARTVARAMQRYGMLLSDAGRVALTARSDRTTRAKWAGLLGPLDLQAIRPRDFAMIEAGARIPLTNDCIRNP